MSMCDQTFDILEIIEQLKEDIAEEKRRKEAIEEEIKELQDNVESLKSSLEDAEDDEIEDLQQELSKQEEALNEATIQRQDAIDNIEGRKAEIVHQQSLLGFNQNEEEKEECVENNPFDNDKTPNTMTLEDLY